MAQYDPRNCEFIVNGFTISGYADESINADPDNEEAVTKSTGVRGEISRAENPDGGGTITIRLHHTSKTSNIFLKALQDTRQAFPVIFKDFSEDSTMIIEDLNTRIKNRQSHERSKENTVVEWVFDLEVYNPIYI